MEASNNVHDLEPGAKRLSLSRWLIDPFRGVATFEGRARLPEGVTPPADFPDWLEVEWEALGGGVFRYRGTFETVRGGGEPEAGIDRVHHGLERAGCRVSFKEM